MENKEIGGGLIFLSLIVGGLAYDAGKTSGYGEAKMKFLDSAYISSCDDLGEYCDLETKDGVKEIPCNEDSKCFAVLKEPKTAEELKKDRETEESIKKLIEESWPEAQKMLD